MTEREYWEPPSQRGSHLHNLAVARFGLCRSLLLGGVVMKVLTGASSRSESGMTSSSCTPGGGGGGGDDGSKPSDDWWNSEETFNGDQGLS